MANTLCNVIWSMNCVYMPNATVGLHTHDYFHYFYVKSGDGYIEIDSQSYKLARGQIYMMQPGILHEIHSGEGGLSAYEIKFNTFDADKLTLLGGLPHSLDLTGHNAEEIFECIFTELQNMGLYYERVVETKLEELILLLLRCNQSQAEARSTLYSEKFSAVLFFMSRNLSSEIDLKMLADIAHMERIYFLKAFKAEIGTTPMDHLRRLRVNAAKKLLVNSDMNITQIASAVGFQTIHHFTGVFKKMTGKSPSEYKLEKKRKSGEVI